MKILLVALIAYCRRQQQQTACPKAFSRYTAIICGLEKAREAA